MSKDFPDVEYTRVQLGSPNKDPGRLNAAFDDTEDNDAQDNDALMNEEEQQKKGPSVLQFEYYQQFFDVETNQVLRRLIGSMIPHPRVNFLTKVLRPKPDLYGPFWVSTTLVFTIAIAGNIANYLQFQGTHQWRYDFKKVTFAATAIYSYWWIVPIMVWSLMKWRMNRLSFGFVELLAVFGYSLTIYIPISIFWVIPVNWLQWLLVLCAMVMSGSVLFFTFLPTLKEGGDKKIGLIVMVTILVLHCALALGFMLYFFHVSPGPSSNGTTVSRRLIITTPLPKLIQQTKST